MVCAGCAYAFKRRLDAARTIVYNLEYSDRILKKFPIFKLKD